MKIPSSKFQVQSWSESPKSEVRSAKYEGRSAMNAPGFK